MIYCDRCGQEVATPGWCDDCIYVEGGASAHRRHPHKGGRRGVAYARLGRREFHYRDLDSEAEDLELYRLKMLGTPHPEIARLIGTHVRTVQRRVNEMGLKS